MLAPCAAARAQPFTGWAVFSGNGTSAGNGHLAVADSPDLNPTSALTVEAWVNLQAPPAVCGGIIGKDYLQGYWLGICNGGIGGPNMLRSSTGPTHAGEVGGIVPLGRWTHLAMTTNGQTRKHYVDGELVATFPESGPPAASSAPLWIGGDVNYPASPSAWINEVRLWNVERSESEIRSTINQPLDVPRPGLVAVWRMASAADSVGGHNGTFAGSVSVASPTVSATCGASTATRHCLWGRFAVSARWRIGPLAGGGASGAAMAAGCGNPGSGLFSFFDPSNWEVMVKLIDGCALNNQWWVFSAATTNVFYRLEVFDVRGGTSKIYFNYPGPPAPAVTDANALPCP